MAISVMLSRLNQDTEKVQIGSWRFLTGCKFRSFCPMLQAFNAVFPLSAMIINIY